MISEWKKNEVMQISYRVEDDDAGAIKDLLGITTNIVGDTDKEHGIGCSKCPAKV